MSAITAKASRKMKKYAVLTREPRCFLGSFDFSWEQRKVSELFRVTRGYVLAATQTETTKTDEKPYPVYSSQTKDKGLMGYYKDYLYEDAITWTTDGANAGTVNYRAGKFYCTNVCGVLLSNEVKANQMIAEALNSVAKGYVSYVGNPKLMNNVMADIVIQIPTQAEEREQLSSFFAKLDNLITLHQRKCALLFSPFQALISMMFTTSTFSWEQRKLSELTSMHARIGWQNLRTSEFLDSGNYMLITGTDFNDGAINFSTCHYVERERYEQDRNIQIHNGSILITKDGTLGKVAYVQGLSMPATLNAGVFNVQIKDANNVDEKYLFQYLKAPFLMDYVDKKATGGTIKHLNQSILVDFPVILPQRSEQTLIGAFFQQLDNLITLHQRKCISFTGRAGRLISTVNKKRITSSWEQRKVSELFRVTRGYVLAATQTETTKTDEKPYPVYSSQTKDKGLMGYYKDYLYEDAITWTTDGANAGTVNYRAGKFYCTNVCGVLLSNEVKANQMIAEALNSVAKGYVSYVGNPKLMNNVMADIVIQIPTQAEEREQLSSFFAKLDNLITLHQRKPFLMKWRNSDANRNQTNRLVL